MRYVANESFVSARKIPGTSLRFQNQLVADADPVLANSIAASLSRSLGIISIQRVSTDINLYTCGVSRLGNGK